METIRDILQRLDPLQDASGDLSVVASVGRVDRGHLPGRPARCLCWSPTMENVVVVVGAGMGVGSCQCPLWKGKSYKCGVERKELQRSVER